MKNLLSKINKVGLFAFVLGLLLIGTQSAFKVAKLTPPADGWFEVTVIDPMQSHSDPTNLAFGTRIDEPDETNEEGCARTGNTGDLCAVFLDFTVSATAVPAKISDVNATYESITDDAQQPL
ncbi:hypothetical protein ABIE26_005346 [Pedobacter africanus]|uniref:Uncharacterized protein n=1 Tax=Pedobacter africanus TaxID=151894 RepID=A0ACC6L4Y1_9SPHI|nr:hypothetical protein [Pedobacter africanus]MDR6786467.1 hypothetical protein [Pedobacter africanus]